MSDGDKNVCFSWNAFFWPLQLQILFQTDITELDFKKLGIINLNNIIRDKERRRGGKWLCFEQKENKLKGLES